MLILRYTWILRLYVTNPLLLHTY